MKKKDPTENLSQLGNLLLRYKKKFKPPQASVEKVAIEVIAEVCGYTLLPHQIEYTVSTKTLTIKAPSLVRSELKTHTVRILQLLRERLLDSAPTTLL
jgi:hypothetical protein